MLEVAGPIDDVQGELNSATKARKSPLGERPTRLAEASRVSAPAAGQGGRHARVVADRVSTVTVTLAS